MISAYSINERATEHCAQMTRSNLVKLIGTPDVDGSYHEKSTSSKPLSPNPDCFDGCSALSKPSVLAQSGIKRFRSGASFKAVWGQRQLIADKGSFDGGPDSQADDYLAIAWSQSGFDSLAGSAGATFRAALPERRINVDRVSIRKGEGTVGAEKLVKCALRRTSVKVAEPTVLHNSWFESEGMCGKPEDASSPFTNADSYSRCTGKRLPDALNIDKRAGWVTAEKLERSGIREDRCRKQVSGRLLYVCTAYVPAALLPDSYRVACGVSRLPAYP